MHFMRHAHARFLICIIAALALVAVAAPAASAGFGLKAKWGAGGGVGGLGLGDGGLVEPVSVAIGPGGNRYVVEQRDCSVRIFSSAGVFVRRWGGLCNASSPTATGFTSPTDIAVDMNGDVYIADQNQNRIQVYDGIGLWKRTIGTSGTTGGKLSSVASVSVTPLSATPDIYVTDLSNVRIQKFAYNGDFVWAAGKDVDAVAAGTGFEVCTAAPNCKSGEPGALSGELNNPYGMDLGAAGGPIVVADGLNNRVQKFNPANGQFISSFAIPFLLPFSVAIDQGTGDVWVDRFGQGSPWLERYDSTGAVTVTASSGTSGAGDGEFGSTGQLTATASGGVISPDYSQHRVQELDASGAFVSKFGLNGGPGWQRGSANGEFSYPHGVFAGDDSVWVADSSNQRVQKFTLDGTFVSKFGSAGYQGKQFNFPNAIAVGTSPDRIYVADGLSHRVQEFDSSDDAFVRAIGRDVSTSIVTANASEICSIASDCKQANSGSGDGQFAYPIDVAISPANGYLYVVSQNSDKIESFDRTTLAHVATIGSSGSGDGQFSAPQAIAFEPDGSFWVAEFNGNRVQKFDATPAHAFLKRFRLGAVNGQSAYPLDLAVVGSELHVSESGLHRIAVFDTAAASVTPKMQPELRTYGALGSNDGDLFQPAQISASPKAGDVYIADAGNSRIQLLGDVTTPPVPSVQITAPAANSIVEDASIELAHTSSNGAGQALNCSPGNGPVPLVMGPNTITVDCADPFGLSIEDVVNVTRIPIDVTPPEVAIDSPLEGAVLISNSVQLMYTASDDSGVDPICTPASGSMVPLTAGPNTISVSCHDAKNNMASASVNVTYVAPIVPAGPTPSTTPTATTPLPSSSPLGLTLGLAKSVKFKGAIAAKVGCDSNCTYTLIAKVIVGKKSYSAKLSGGAIAGIAVGVRVKFKSKHKKVIKAALIRGTKLKAVLSLSAVSGSGAKAKKSSTIKLRM